MAELKIKKRHIIKKSQISRLKDRLAEEIGEGVSLFPFEKVERVETGGEIIFYLLNRKPLLMESEGWVFPTLRGAVECPFPQRRIVVDSGAVRFMVNGADVMRPGVVSVTDDVRQGRPAVVTEERHQKPLAVTIALAGSEEIRQMEKGKTARNIHYIGDDIWNLVV